MNTISSYDLGFIEGMGGVIKTSPNNNGESYSELLLTGRFLQEDSTDQSINALLDLSESCYLVEDVYRVRCSEDVYNTELNKYVSDTTVSTNTRKFMLGYITSNGTITPDGNLKLVFKNENILMLFNLLATPTITNSKDPNNFTITVIYNGLSAMDVLNCYHVVSPFEEFSLPRKDLENARNAYNNNPNNGTYLKTVFGNDVFNGSVKAATCQTLKYAKLVNEAVPPSKFRSSDAGYDLTLISKIKQVGDVTFYGTGIALAPPDGYYLQLVPRSSISKTVWMLANSVGIIDPTYRGEIIVALRNTGNNKAEELELPNRIVQVIPVAIRHFDISAVDSLNNTSRNSGGFGSTGK